MRHLCLLRVWLLQNVLCCSWCLHLKCVLNLHPRHFCTLFSIFCRGVGVSWEDGGWVKKGACVAHPLLGGSRGMLSKTAPLPPLLLPLGLLSYRTSFMSKYQVLCYCSLAKPGPHTKSKILVSQDRYGIVFMHGQNVMADISARSQSFHFGFCPCILILGHCLVSQP